MKISRRRLTTGAAGLVSLGGLASLAPLGRLARAQGTDDEPHFFLFIQIYGAWDVCMAFDPKDRDALRPNGERRFDQPYAMSEVRDFGGIPLPPDGQILGSYADRMAIINGIDMEADNGHTPDTVMTGTTTARQSGAPYVQALLAKRHPFLKRLSVPHLYSSYDGQFIAGPYGSSSISASPVDFLALIDGGGAGGGGGGDMTTLHGLLAEHHDAMTSPSRRRVFRGYVEAVQSALDVDVRLKAGGFQRPADVTTPVGVANLLGQLFSARVLGAATLSFGTSSKFFFDTHNDHYARHPLKDALIEVDAICKELQRMRLDDNHSIFDKTTVVVTGEFARTSLLNSAAGKDHNIHTNSLLAIGHGVKAGVYGLADGRDIDGRYEPHAGLPVDLVTGKPSATGRILKARDVWAGFGGVAGVDLSSEFGPDAAPIRFLG